jgi:Adenylate and Guanylate cyclase catalytic domain
VERERAAVTTILFTDLVGSTELMRRVGDERAQDLFAAHHRLLADAVAAHGGSELQWLGDGLMVAFVSSADAVRCAVTMQQAGAQRSGPERLGIRVGLNVGEMLRQEIGIWFAQARGVLDEQGARPLRALADFDEARMELRRGPAGAARAGALLAAARTQFEALGIHGWLRRADALAAGGAPIRNPAGT